MESKCSKIKAMGFGFWWGLFCFVLFVAKLKCQVNPTFRNADLFRLNISGQKPFHQELLQLKATEMTFFFFLTSSSLVLLLLIKDGEIKRVNIIKWKSDDKKMA